MESKNSVITNKSKNKKNYSNKAIIMELIKDEVKKIKLEFDEIQNQNGKYKLQIIELDKLLINLEKNNLILKERNLYIERKIEELEQENIGNSINNAKMNAQLESNVKIINDRYNKVVIKNNELENEIDKYRIIKEKLKEEISKYKEEKLKNEEKFNENYNKLLVENKNLKKENESHKVNIEDLKKKNKILKERVDAFRNSKLGKVNMFYWRLRKKNGGN